jgi:hypothetical protein
LLTDSERLFQVRQRRLIIALGFEDLRDIVERPPLPRFVADLLTDSERLLQVLQRRLVIALLELNYYRLKAVGLASD